jgi:hypothetical protein
MPTPSFHDWLNNRPDEAPAAEKLATLIAGAGAAGISHDRLRRLVRLPPETLQDILRSLAETGQVTVPDSDGVGIWPWAAVWASEGDCHQHGFILSFGHRAGGVRSSRDGPRNRRP